MRKTANVLQVCSALLLGTASVATAQISGSIFSSTKDGSVVNANLFDTKDQVYLNGGPQNQNGSGLPDGIYYYQVTDPSGSVLLSTDPARCRQVVVSGGRFAGPFSSETCSHAAGTPDQASGQTGVQLIPFDDSPNGGGVYKVWLISQAAGCNTSVADGSPVVSFVSSCSKTDNFKVSSGGTVPPNSLLTGVKYRDANRNGTMDIGEVGLANWTINLYTLDGSGNVTGTMSTTTDGNGFYTFAVLSDAKVKICEAVPAGWVQYGPLTSATTGGGTFTVTSSRCWTGTVGGADVGSLNFGNLDRVRLSGLKFYDSNGNGTQDAGEPALSGWTIQLKDSGGINVLQTATTAPDGTYYFEVAPGSTPLQICEVQETAYKVSTGGVCIPVTPNADSPNNNFGNYIPVSGMKYYDINRNGINNGNPPEQGIPGFKILLAWCDNATCAAGNPGYPSAPVQTATTVAGGTWSAIMPPPPTNPAPATLYYQACEVVPLATTFGNWTQTGPNAGAVNSDGSATVVGRCWIGQVGAAEAAPQLNPGANIDFGNACVGPKLGLTIGYWSNKNGQSRITTSDLAALSALNLRNADGSSFDPPTDLVYGPKALANWLLSASATNMAYMLSAQMAATDLNVLRNGLSGSVQVWFNNGWVAISQAIIDANALLSDGSCGTSCVVLSGNALRTQMEAYKNLFDSINNNTALIGPASCPVNYPQ